MTSSDIIALIITGTIAAGIIVMSVFLLKGKGSFLIAGFNIMTKEEKEQYDVVALCQFMGKIMLPVGVLMPMIALGGIFDIPWLGIAYGIITVSLIIFALVYSNTKNRFKR